MPEDTNGRPVLSAFVLALLLLAAATYLYSFYQQKQKEVAIENSNNLTRTQKHPQLYCIKAVPAGAIVTTDCLEIREVTQDQPPPDGLSNPSGALGRGTKYGLKEGEPVCGYMFGTSTKEMMKFNTYSPRLDTLPAGNFYKGVRINRG